MKESPITISLDVWLQQQPSGLAWRQTADVVTAVADILANIHARGDCHAGICPDHIRYSAGNGPSPGEWRLDSVDKASRASRSVVLCMPPERFLANRPNDPRCDVYALGVILYRMLCNRYPFRSIDREDLQREIVEDAPQPPRQLAHGIPLELERLCLRLLSKEPSARPANGEELARELRKVIAGAETFDSSADLSGSATMVRQAPATLREMDLLLVLSWKPSTATPRLQQALREFIERRQGNVLQQTESSTVARPARVRDLPAGMATLLDCAMTGLAELRLKGMAAGFSVDSAETDALKHRAPRLSGRIAASGLEVTPQSMEVVCRWLPCRALVESNQFEVTTVAQEPLHVSVGECGEEGPNSKSPPLVGRNAQLAILKTRWDQAREGMGQIVLLIGEEGMGKTRLIQEFRGYVANPSHSYHWVKWICRPRSDDWCPHPAIEYFRDPSNGSSIKLGEGELAELTSLHPRERWQQALIVWLKRMATISPTVFVVEDLQWGDPITLGLLHTLMDLGLHERVLTILTCRPEFETPWGSRAHQTQVALNRLTRRHAASIFSSITGMTEPSSSAVEQLLDASDGIPLFVEGFARRLVS